MVKSTFFFLVLLLYMDLKVIHMTLAKGCADIKEIDVSFTKTILGETEGIKL